MAVAMLMLAMFVIGFTLGDVLTWRRYQKVVKELVTELFSLAESLRETREQLTNCLNKEDE